MLKEGSDRIATLEQEIADVRAMMAQTESDQAALDEATRAEIARVQPVADFFVIAQAEPAPEPANDVDADYDDEEPEPSIIIDKDLVAGK